MSDTSDWAVPTRSAVKVMAVTLPLAFYLGCIFNMVAWLGGPVFFCGGFISAVLWAASAYAITARRASLTRTAVRLGIVGWLVTECVLFPIGDQMETTRLQSEAVAKAKRIGNGELPPNCIVGLPWRAMPRTPIHCQAKVAEIASFYESRLDDKYQRSRDRFAILFDNGTSGFRISPTEAGCDLDFW